MSKVLVTGGSGFIGSNLIPELLKKSYEVYALNRYVTGRYNQSAKEIVADLNDHDQMREIIIDLKPEYVIHLGAISAVSYSYTHPFEVLQTNFISTVNLAEVNRKYNPNLKQFLYAGTSEEYGIQSDFPINESAELRPNSPYAVSKVAADKYLNYVRYAYNFPVTILRPFNTYGRIDNVHFVTEKIISQMLQEEKELMLGDLDPIRDLLYVSDHVNAYLTCIGNEEALGQTFNFCTDVGTSIKGLVDIIADITDFNGKVIEGTIPPRPLDIKVLIGDYGKAEETLGWVPQVNLKDGLKMTVAEWRRKLCER